MAQEETVVIDGLSCTNCRRKKVRCSRTTPKCDRCSTYNFSCQYPRRKTRKSTKDRSGSSSGDGALSLILDRLQRIEESYTFTASNPTSAIDQEVVGSPTAYASPRGVLGEHGPSRFLSHPSVPLERQPSTSSCENTSPQSATHIAFDCHSIDTPPVDVASALSDTFDRVRDQRLRLTLGPHAMATQGIEIPSDLSKTWIRNYFTYEATETFLSLVDRKTIEMIPDLLDTKHVRLDPCILILYYVILWRGCFILNTRSYSSSDGCYAGQLYLCCLRIIPIWQREATGCVTDFVAAIFMTGISNESFDYETSLEMHKLACEYGKGLQMHVLDGSGKPTAAGPSWTDNDRRGMWELFQTDLFYHLIYNKPASLLRHLGDWRVNLPWLSLGSSPDNSAPLSTIAFLVRSRLTFILIEFFQKLKTLDTEPEAIATIEPLCHQVELLFEEWSIEAWLDRSSHDQMNLWILSGLILTGYTCILYMLRKATLLNSNSPNPAVGNIPRTDLALRASRRLLKLTYQMLHVWKFPAIEAISYILGAYRAHIAYATVASNALEAPHAEYVAADLELLDGVASTIENVASGEKDFAPLARAMKMLNADIRSKAETVETIQEVN